MSCLPSGCKQTDANSIIAMNCTWISPGRGEGAIQQFINLAGGGRGHLLLLTGGGDLNYLLADETNHKQVSEREGEKCHNATLQLLTDSHTDQISRTLTGQQTAALPSALARTIWRIGYKKFLEIFVKIDWRKKSSGQS